MRHDRGMSCLQARASGAAPEMNINDCSVFGHTFIIIESLVTYIIVNFLVALPATQIHAEEVAEIRVGQRIPYRPR